MYIERFLRGLTRRDLATRRPLSVRNVGCTPDGNEAWKVHS